LSRPNSQADGLNNNPKPSELQSDEKQQEIPQISEVVPDSTQVIEQPTVPEEKVSEIQNGSKPISRDTSKANIEEEVAVSQVHHNESTEVSNAEPTEMVEGELDGSTEAASAVIKPVEPQTSTSAPEPNGAPRSQSQAELARMPSASKLSHVDLAGNEVSKSLSNVVVKVPSKGNLTQSKSNLANSKQNLHANDPSTSRQGSPASLRKAASVKFSQQLESTSKSQTSLTDKTEIKSSLKKSKNDLHGSKSLQDLSPKRSQSSLASKSASNLHSDNDVISIPVPSTPAGPTTEITPLTNRRVIMDETMRLPSKSASLKRKQMKPVSESETEEVEYHFAPRPPISRTPSRFQSVTRAELETESIPV
jgi:hypothetical protein